MRKGYAGAVLLLAMALVAVACGSSKSGSAASTSGGGATPKGNPIVIGFDVDQTGAAASYSVPPFKADQAEINYLNKHGGILGRPVKMVVGNDESDPTKVNAVLQQLANQGAVFIQYLSSGSVGAAAKPTIEQLKIPLMAATNSSSVFPQPPNNDYVYSISEPNSVIGQAYCNGMQNAGIHNIALLEDNTPTIAAFGQQVLATMPCVKVVNKQVAPVDATDISAEVARLNSPKPDAILIFTAVSQFEILAHNTIYQQYPKMQVFASSVLGNDPPGWKLANAHALAGSVFFSALDPANKATIDVQNHLRTLLGSNYVLDQFSAQGYQGLLLMEQAFKMAGTDDPAALNRAMESIKANSVIGYPGFTLSYSAAKHAGPDGPCGTLLVQFGDNNTPKGPYPDFKPQC